MDYVSLVKTLAGDTQGGVMLILAAAIFGCINYFITNRQTKKIGSNHLEHLKKDITDHIDLHERREMEQGRQMVEALGRIERAIIEQGRRRK